MPRIIALTATRANMERVAGVPGIFVYDRETGDRYSASSGDYFTRGMHEPLYTEGARHSSETWSSTGAVCILARAKCEIVPVRGQ